MKRSYEIIVNPASRSGRGQHIWQELVPVLTEMQVSYQVHFSEKAGDCKEIAQTLSAKYSQENLCHMIVLGGDGTLNEVMQGITDLSCFCVGYIPTGSSNDFARALGIPTTPKDALLLILNSEQATSLDIGRVTFGDSAKSFAVSCGVGFDAAVCREALHSKSKKLFNKIGLGKLTYLTIALKQLFAAKKVSCDVKLTDGSTIHFKHIYFVVAMIHAYEGGGFMFCPDADCKDGCLDICIAGNIPKWKVLRILPTAFKGEHFRFRGLHRLLVKEITIQLSTPLWVHTDGEVSEKANFVHIACERQTLQVFVPSQ